MMCAHTPAPVRDRDGPTEVLVCFAVREEARFFRAPIRPATSVLITGIGVQSTSAIIQDYLSKHQPRLVLTCGFAGGLNPVHPLGRVLIDATHAGPFRHKLDNGESQTARFVHANRVITTAREKAQLFEASGGDAVEMESTAIVAACQKQGTPVVVIRVVSDAATEDLPVDFNQFTRPDGSFSLPRLLLGIAGSPSAVPGLIRFRARVRRAAENLAATLEQLLEVL